MFILQIWSMALSAVAAALFAGATFLPGIMAQIPSGDQWVNNIASNQDIHMVAMALSPINEVHIAGTFHGTVDFDPGPNQTLLTSGASDTSFIAKYDAAGNLIWAYRLVGSGDVIINDIVVDRFAGIGVVGSFEDSADLDPGPGNFHAVSKGGHDIFLLRLLPDGTLDWGWTKGGDSDDKGFAVATDQNAALYITGNFEGNVDWKSFIGPDELAAGGGADIFMGRFSNAGFFSWVQVLGGDEDDAGTDIGVDGKGNVFAVGTFAGLADLDPKHTSTDTRSHGRDDIFVSVVNQGGDRALFQTSLGGQRNESNARILVNPDGSFYVAAQFESDADLDARTAGGVVTSHGETDIFVARFGIPVGFGYQWGYALGGPANETLAGLAKDSSGDLYLLGAFGATVDFDLGAGVSEVTSSGADDIFLGVYSDQMQFRRVQAMFNPQQDRAGALAITATNNVVFGGEYSGSINLGNGLSVSSGQPDGIFNLFVARYATPR